MFCQSDIDYGKSNQYFTVASNQGGADNSDSTEVNVWKSMLSIWHEIYI